MSADIDKKFQFDVFLSYSASDKLIVRELASKLKEDGIRVWFDEEQIGSGGNISAKIEAGLEESRTLVTCISINALESEWAQLESYTFRFRDPEKEDRRFIPVKLDNAPTIHSIAQFLHIDLFGKHREAGQIYRGYTNSDHGIDGEIEFKDDRGRASGKRLYMQLKSGDSYLKKRQSDGAEIFYLKNPRWATYWRQQAYVVMLVIRSSNDEIRWMDVTAYLKRESVGGKIVKQIVFRGERFDALSIQQWRKRILGL